MDKLPEILHGVAAHTHQLTSASRQLLETSEQITADSERPRSSPTPLRSDATGHADWHSLSTGAGEMTATVQSIAANAHEAASASSAVRQSSAEIGLVIKVIASIERQINLLAFNATIEAARAGQAGKGFAVVANELKEVANQTAKATEEISRKIAGIQADTKGAFAALGTVSDVIHQSNDISATIATAVEEQSATTSEMTHNTSEPANGGRRHFRQHRGGGAGGAGHAAETSARGERR